MSCKECNRHKTSCGCGCERRCGCARPILDIDEMPDSVSTLRFNIDGLSSWYNYGNMIYQTQTDTTISADSINRVLKYMAERHVDTISARELGSILHVADLADVDASGVENNSIFVYRKNSDCAHGCTGINNKWTAWNSSENVTSSDIKYLMGFNSNDAPYAVQPPDNPDGVYLLGWDKDDKIKYMAIQEAASVPTAEEGGVSYKYNVYVDPSTGKLVYVKEAVE